MNGLSPRRRGNRHSRPRRAPTSGSIPALAGEPCPKRRAAGPHRVYPRAGGGTAWHGSPHRFDKVYPRAGGGTFTALVPGLSPRRRGNQLGTGSAGINPRRLSSWGLSPRRRGNPSRQAQRVYPRAPARRRGNRGGKDRVYPRAGGGTGEPGLSPRRRGNRHDAGMRGGLRGLSPRRRGNPRSLPPIGSIPAQAGDQWLSGLSPRRRGNLESRALSARAIPAQAGEPSGRSRGLSPRRRGNQLRHLGSAAHRAGSIPAQAGEPLVTKSLNYLQCQRT